MRPGGHDPLRGEVTTVSRQCPLRQQIEIIFDVVVRLTEELSQCSKAQILDLPVGRVAGKGCSETVVVELNYWTSRRRCFLAAGNHLVDERGNARTSE